MRARGKLSEDTLERIEALLSEFREENIWAPIIVEGRRDEKALRALRFQGKIIVLNQGVSLADLSQRISEEHSEVIILTDWDRKGGTLAGKLYKLLTDCGVKCDMEFRNLLMLYTSSQISTVEELPSLF